MKSILIATTLLIATAGINCPSGRIGGGGATGNLSGTWILSLDSAFLSDGTPVQFGSTRIKFRSGPSPSGGQITEFGQWIFDGRTHSWPLSSSGCESYSVSSNVGVVGQFVTIDWTYDISGPAGTTISYHLTGTRTSSTFVNVTVDGWLNFCGQRSNIRYSDLPGELRKSSSSKERKPDEEEHQGLTVEAAGIY